MHMIGVMLADNGGHIGDNKAVVDSASIPDYNLKKRHYALSFHRIREAVVSKIVHYYHINGDDNLADMLIKLLLHHKWWPLMRLFLHWFNLVGNGKSEDEPNCGGVNRNSTRSTRRLLQSKGAEYCLIIIGGYYPRFRSRT